MTSIIERICDALDSGYKNSDKDLVYSTRAAEYFEEQLKMTRLPLYTRMPWFEPVGTDVLLMSHIIDFML